MEKEERKKIEENWKKDKILRRIVGMLLLHNLFYKGTFYYHGIGQRNKKLPLTNKK